MSQSYRLPIVAVLKPCLCNDNSGELAMSNEYLRTAFYYKFYTGSSLMVTMLWVANNKRYENLVNAVSRQCNILSTKLETKASNHVEWHSTCCSFVQKFEAGCTNLICTRTVINSRALPQWEKEFLIQFVDAAHLSSGYTATKNSHPYAANN